MRARFSHALGLAVVATLGVTPMRAVAQRPSTGSWRVSRTPWGDPDFDGVWNYATMTPLERPREFGDKAVLSQDEAAAYESRTLARQAAGNATAGPDWWDPAGQHLAGRRTSLVVEPADGHLPPLTADAQRANAARAQARRRGPAEGPEDLGLNERCLQWSIAGPPMMPGPYNNIVQFVQTRDYVVIVNEILHETRIVPMDGRAHGTMTRWMGDSRGHWDGATLVVDTVNFNDRTSVRGSDTHLHLVERFTRVGADEMEYRFTIDDPTIWTQPWTVVMPFAKIDGIIYEFACHEGNERSIEGTLKGARIQDAK